MSGRPMVPVAPEKLAMLVELLPTVESLRDLCAITGLPLETVRREAAPFLALMKLHGTHPKCGCGRDRFHPYGCVDSTRKGRNNPNFGANSEIVQRQRARREAIIAMLMAGDRFVDIDQAFGMIKASARKYLRFLTPDQLAQREAAVVRQRPSARWGAARAKAPEVQTYGIAA